jgi:long-chain acyl-CoA synthetase
LLTYANIEGLVPVAGLFSVVDECVSHREFVLGYLPLAHAIEMGVENLVFFIGATMGYGSPRTISDTSTRNCAGDMRELRPTVVVGVPQVWETIKKGVLGKLETASPIARNLFWTAYHYKSFMLRNKLPLATVLDGIVFSKVREMTGGRVRFTFNGGSPISDNTKEFISMVVAPMMTGYGLTETCANGALGTPLQYSPNSIGAPSAAIEVKLVSIEELNYSADDPKNPQGEIWARGKSVTTEYFGNQDETTKVLTEDGWFKTGDIGEWAENGHLRIIDRVKNLIKLAGGEYIALEKLETIYRGSQLVQNVMIHASVEHSRPIAVITPVEPALAAKAKDLGVDSHDMHKDDAVRKLVLKDLQDTAKRSGLVGMEVVANVVITDEEWTPQNVS